jgi:hypothetical protein
MHPPASQVRQFVNLVEQSGHDPAFRKYEFWHEVHSEGLQVTQFGY